MAWVWGKSSLWDWGVLALCCPTADPEIGVKLQVYLECDGRGRERREDCLERTEGPGAAAGPWSFIPRGELWRNPCPGARGLGACRSIRHSLDEDGSLFLPPLSRGRQTVPGVLHATVGAGGQGQSRKL